MDKKNTYPIALLVAGLVLMGLGFAEVVDEFWSGMGSALLVMGIIRLLRFYRLKKNDTYREKMETAVTDERNQFIRMKAWSWAGYLFIMVSAIATIILKILGQDLPGFQWCRVSDAGAVLDFLFCSEEKILTLKMPSPL